MNPSTILSYADYDSECSFDADIVVVGTGAGGAAAGTELAEAGRDVLFVEEGGYHPTTSFNPYTTESVPRLYRDASSLPAHVHRGRKQIGLAHQRAARRHGISDNAHAIGHDLGEKL